MTREQGDTVQPTRWAVGQSCWVIMDERIGPPVLPGRVVSIEAVWTGPSVLLEDGRRIEAYGRIFRSKRVALDVVARALAVRRDELAAKMVEMQRSLDAITSAMFRVAAEAAAEVEGEREAT